VVINEDVIRRGDQPLIVYENEKEEVAGA